MVCLPSEGAVLVGLRRVLLAAETVHAIEEESCESAHDDKRKVVNYGPGDLPDRRGPYKPYALVLKVKDCIVVS